MITSINMTLPIDIKNNISLYDLEIELSYSILNSTNINVDLNLRVFNENINMNIFSLINGNDSGLKKITLNDLKYNGNSDTSNMYLIFTFSGTSMGNGSLVANRVELKPKNQLTNEYYNTYTDPEFLYSHNNSINGLLNNSDKNSIHVFLNDKFKNILVILNENIPMNIDWKSLNNIDVFGENYGLYNGKSYDDVYDIYPSQDIVSNKYNPNNITAVNFIKSLNTLNDKGLFDININYHYIDIDGNYAKTQFTQFNNSTFNNLPNWGNNFPPFLLETNISEKLKINNNSYIVTPIDGPNTNIKDKFIIYENGSPLSTSIINEPLGRSIIQNNKYNKSYKVNHSENIIDYKIINRFVGYYEPTIKNIHMYTPLYYWKDNDTFKQINGNYKFNDEIDQFAIINELMYSKVNEKEYFLKLKDVNEPSIYPMIDEIGLSQTKKNIFSSSWDNDYLIRTLNDTTLYDYIDSISMEQSYNISGKFDKVINNEIGYYYGIPIYGKNINQTSITYSFNIVNLSNIIQKFTYIIKYHSSYATYIVSSGTTSDISINGKRYLIINIDRPSEIKSSSFYEEFTKWSVIFELYNTNGDLLDIDDNILFNVYNDIINFTFTDPYGQGGFYNSGETFSPYYVDKQYDFSITLNETYDKLKNIKYIFNLKSLTINEGSSLYNKIMNYGSIDYDVYDNLLNMENDFAYNLINNYISSDDTLLTLGELVGDITTTKKLNFDNINIPLNNLSYNTTEKRIILFETIHKYPMGLTVSSLKKGLIKIIHVDRIQEKPNLFWYPWSTTDMVKNDMEQGSTNYGNGNYSGDLVYSGVKISNNGGSFSGIIKVVFNWRENGVTIAQKYITQELLNLEKNDPISFDIILGPLDITNKPIVTYSHKNYDVKVTTSYIDISKLSYQKNGFKN